MRHVMMLGIGLAVAGLIGALIAAGQPNGIPLVLGGIALLLIGGAMTFVALVRRQT